WFSISISIWLLLLFLLWLSLLVLLSLLLLFFSVFLVWALSTENASECSVACGCACCQNLDRFSFACVAVCLFEFDSHTLFAQSLVLFQCWVQLALAVWMTALCLNLCACVLCCVWPEIAFSAQSTARPFREGVA